MLQTVPQILHYAQNGFKIATKSVAWDQAEEEDEFSLLIRGDSDAWISIDSSTECIPPTSSQPLSPCQVMTSDDLCPQIGDTGELLGDQQLSLTPIPAIEINPDKNLNPEVHSFEGFSSEQGDVITPVQHNSRKMPQNNNPTNPTIILVEPSMEDEAKNKKNLANDVALSKALANFALGIPGISNMKKNLGRNILVVTMKKHYEDVSSFLSVLEIGAWKVKCRLPANQITSVVAIGPFGKDTSSEELTEALIDAGFGGVTMKRIYKGKDKIVTAFFKVVFNTTTLPQFVRIGYQQYRVSTYIGKPWQCFRCQRLGHNAVNCRAAPRCVVCSGAHNSRECPSPSTRSCCNCSGNHTANYGGCPKIRQAREVEKIRQIQKLSYRDAARQVLHAGGTSLVQPHSDQTLNISMVSQSGGKDQYSSKAQPTKLVSVGTQTGDELISPTSPNVTVTQLVELLARTLTAVTRQDEDLNLKDLIIEIVKDTFKSQVLNTSANNERPLTAQPQYNDCSDPSNLMTTLDLPTT
ncbi:hypothetical protein FHG87_012454 [Trinorchestia longiramus]|nr:hypothetical protein FHG87_012454 [Trinorchestia longiramus]